MHSRPLGKPLLQYASGKELSDRDICEVVRQLLEIHVFLKRSRYPLHNLTPASIFLTESPTGSPFVTVTDYWFETNLPGTAYQRVF